MPAKHVEREFWRLIARGRRTEEAALEIGVSTPVASRWFRHAGGMPPLSLAEPTGRYLSFHEREELALLNAQGLGVRAIARELKRDPRHDLSRATAQRGDPQPQDRVPGDGRAVEGAGGRAASQAGEARDQPAAAEIRAGTAERAAAASGRQHRGGTPDDLGRD
jgi:hypothetical protein